MPSGLALGTLAAVNRGRLSDRVIMACSVAGVSMPVFFIGLILIQYVGFKWALLPFTGRTGPVWDGGLPSLILPATTLGLVLMANPVAPWSFVLSAGILIGLAAPSIANFTRASRIAASSRDLVTDFAFARNEAVMRAQRVSVCTSANLTSCANSSWGQGRLVFVDGGTAGTIDGTDLVLLRTRCSIRPL